MEQFRLTFFFSHKIQIKPAIFTPGPESFFFSKIHRFKVRKIFYRIVIRVYSWCCFSSCAVICVQNDKNGRYNSALWRASRNRTGKIDFSLLTNSLRVVDKQVNDPEDQFQVYLEIQQCVCYEEWLYKIEGGRKLDEENRYKRTWFYEASV